jgi:hypothetical protein
MVVEVLDLRQFLPDTGSHFLYGLSVLKQDLQRNNHIKKTSLSSSLAPALSGRTTCPSSGLTPRNRHTFQFAKQRKNTSE